MSRPPPSFLTERSSETQSFTTTATVAKCTGCLLELDFNQIEVDVKELGESANERS